MSLRRLSALAVAVALAIALAACGGDNDSVSQAELQRATEEAAASALQEEKLKRLQRQVSKLKKGDSNSSPSPPSSGSTSGSGAQGLYDWPGGSGYTAILASVSSESAARRVQAEASSSGLDAGVLFSSSFPSLRPGFWVVFSGTFTANGGAVARATRAQDLGYADAYPRFVSP